VLAIGRSVGSSRAGRYHCLLYRPGPSRRMGIDALRAARDRKAATVLGLTARPSRRSARRRASRGANERSDCRSTSSTAACKRSPRKAGFESAPAGGIQRAPRVTFERSRRNRG